MLNNTLTSKKDIERITGIPVISEIYKYDAPKRVVLNERSVLTEQVLNLRNNLRFLLNDVNHTPAILFTSSISGEGKTFISSHLGNALTYNNKRAILLELDLRKPKLSMSLGINNSSGLTNYLVGVETFDQVVKKVPGNNSLDIIPSGPVPPNPIELIESDKMRQLFAMLREKYDYIIVDTSPIGMVSDAKSLSPYIDASLFVARFNYTPKIKFREIVGDIDKSVFKKVGIVFNGVDLESSYGYYSYGYSDYGYGYGMENVPKKNFLVRFFRNLRQRVF
jgi:capsular exopolysaccharide synthesis family protein